MHARQCKNWRRGWDSTSLALLNPRKLLILRGATNARTALIAQVGYSFGTDGLRKLASRLLPQLSPLVLAHLSQPGIRSVH
jgi:hypothetical protein